MNKNDLRVQIKKQFASYAPELALENSAKALVHLKEFLTSRQKKNILIYSSLKDELQTGSFFENIDHSFEIYLPKVASNNLLNIYKIDSVADDLEVGAFGILEPKEFIIPADLNVIDAIVVPARAIDFNGNRLGRGKGYYDRLLLEAKQKKILIIGLVFHFQWIDSIPIEDHDVWVSYVVTENGTFQIRR